MTTSTTSTGFLDRIQRLYVLQKRVEKLEQYRREINTILKELQEHTATGAELPPLVINDEPAKTEPAKSGLEGVVAPVSVKTEPVHLMTADQFKDKVTPLIERAEQKKDLFSSAKASKKRVQAIRRKDFRTAFGDFPETPQSLYKTIRDCGIPVSLAAVKQHLNRMERDMEVVKTKDGRYKLIRDNR